MVVHLSHDTASCFNVKLGPVRNLGHFKLLTCQVDLKRRLFHHFLHEIFTAALRQKGAFYFHFQHKAAVKISAKNMM